MDNNGKKKRILVIEDEPVIRHVSVRILKADGFLVDTAENGFVAKEMASKFEYDLYVCDIRMPEIDGMEFYECLRQVHPGFESRIVFVSGDTMNHDVETFLRNKNNLFVVKPFTPDELRIVTGKALKLCSK